MSTIPKLIPAMAQEPAQIDRNDFASQAEEQSPGLLREFADFLLHNKKWWLTPIIILLLLLGGLLILGAAAPYIYTMF